MLTNSEILSRLMSGEIDAAAAAARIKALPPAECAEYVVWTEGTFPPGHIQAKAAELNAALGLDPSGPAA
jgi:hypothetical protein